jgi:hypothetical protein
MDGRTGRRDDVRRGVPRHASSDFSRRGSKYDENLGPVIEEVGDLSQRLGEIWTDELPAYQQMDHEHQTVAHDDEYVSKEGIHTNQVECLWSLLEPWLANSVACPSRAWNRPLIRSDCCGH